jgi:hypothetical protein
MATVTPPRVGARVGAIPESVTLAVEAESKALRAGRPAGAGQPGLPAPEHVKAVCRDPRNHRCPRDEDLRGRPFAEVRP